MNPVSELACNMSLVAIPEGVHPSAYIHYRRSEVLSVSNPNKADQYLFAYVRLYICLPGNIYIYGAYVIMWNFVFFCFFSLYVHFHILRSRKD